MNSTLEKKRITRLKMQPSLDKIIKTLAILLALQSTETNAGYLDVGIDKQSRINAKFYANGFIIDASKGEDEKFGAGFGFQEKEYEIYLGLGYSSNDRINDIYTFSELVYRNGRHSIYDLSVLYDNDRPVGKIGFTYLFSETFGVIAKHDFTNNQLFLGVRKWIR